MKTNWKKNFIVYFLLTVISVSNSFDLLHGLSHNDDPANSIDCELCIFHTQSELHHAVLESSISFELKTILKESKDNLEGYTYLIQKDLSRSSFYCRPPPHRFL